MAKSKKEKPLNKNSSSEKKGQESHNATHDSCATSPEDSATFSASATSAEQDVSAEKEERLELEQRIAELEGALAVAQDEKKEVEEWIKRQKAEFDNFRRRSEEEKKSFKLLANEQLLLDFLPIVDNFEKALDVKADDAKIKSFLEGFSFIYKQLLDVLSNNHVVSSTKVGDVFDHNIHRALDFEQGDGDEDTVVEVFQKGFYFHDKVIRLSGVKVKKKKVLDEKESGGDVSSEA